MINFRRLIRTARPLQLILAALTFSLGAGISHYLGQTINILVFGVGLLAILSIQAATAWLAEQFRLPVTPLLEGETAVDRENFRVTLLQSSYAALTLVGAIVVSLLVTARLNPPSAALIGVIILFMVAYALPPLHLAENGFGELIMAVYIGTLSPALAFLLENGEVHRLLTFATFPLTLLALAYFLVIAFPSYGTDMKLGRQSLLTRLTWQRAIPIHHLLLLGAYLFFASAPFFGFPWGLVWPALVVLPFAIIQIIWLQRISMGGPTLWTFITTLSLATFGLTAYLLAFTFWTR
jgi:1,4-dihydroxy-2-naphthoate octaprenyltransferase